MCVRFERVGGVGSRVRSSRIQNGWRVGELVRDAVERVVVLRR